MKTALLLLALVGAGMGSALPSPDAAKPMPLLKVEPVPGAPVFRHQRIISGTPAAEGQFPNQAALSFNGWFCGGSLITRRTILTAAHCTDGMSSVTAYLGAVVLYEGKAFRTTQYAQHEEYDENKLINDVAVLYFSEDISGDNIAPVVLTSGSSNFAGEPAIASGWGITTDGGSISPVLNFVQVNVISPFVCSLIYGSSTAHESVICSRGPGNSGVCSGDSGGPLILASTGEQIGIMSFAAGNACELGLPSGYARITNLRSWIDAHTV